MPSQGLAGQVGGCFSMSQGVVREIPERLFALLGFIYSPERFFLMFNLYQEGVVVAVNEFALKG